ncbi:MAG: hypothetical protein ACK4TJ_09485 [Tabrizicola sp.]
MALTAPSAEVHRVLTAAGPGGADQAPLARHFNGCIPHHAATAHGFAPAP